MQGKGIAHEGVVVSEPVTFSVDTRHAGIAELDVAVVSAECEALDVVMRQDDVDKCLYECRYTPRDAVTHSVIVTYGHVNVTRSPFKVSLSVSTHTDTHIHTQTDKQTHTDRHSVIVTYGHVNVTRSPFKVSLSVRLRCRCSVCWAAQWAQDESN